MLGVPSGPRRELPRGRARAVAEVGKFKVVSAAIGGVHGELVLENEASVSDHAVDGDEALEGHGGVVGGVEAVHEGFDGGGGGGA